MKIIQIIIRRWKTESPTFWKRFKVFSAVVGGACTTLLISPEWEVLKPYYGETMTMLLTWGARLSAVSFIFSGMTTKKIDQNVPE